MTRRRAQDAVTDAETQAKERSQARAKIGSQCRAGDKPALDSEDKESGDASRWWHSNSDEFRVGESCRAGRDALDESEDLCII